MKVTRILCIATPIVDLRSQRPNVIEKQNKDNNKCCKLQKEYYKWQGIKSNAGDSMCKNNTKTSKEEKKGRRMNHFEKGQRAKHLQKMAFCEKFFFFLCLWHLAECSVQLPDRWNRTNNALFVSLVDVVLHEMAWYISVDCWVLLFLSFLTVCWLSQCWPVSLGVMR